MVKNNALKEVITAKYNDANLKEEFKEFIYSLSTKQILWAHEYIRIFPRKFIVNYQKMSFIVYLISLEDRVVWLKEKLDQLIKNQVGKYEHPYLVYYYLQKFQEELEEQVIDPSLSKATEEIFSETKKKAKKTAKTSPLKQSRKTTPKKKELIEELFIVSRESKENIKKQIEKIKRKLKVPRKWKKLNSNQLLEELLDCFEVISMERHQLEKEKINLEIELEHYKNPDYIHPEYKRAMEDLQGKYTQIQQDLLQEKSKNEILEKEVQRLTELIIENPTISVQQEELEMMKREYQLLSEKYDLLVSKNIELRNILEQQSHVKTLHEALNKVRDRINRVLKTGGLTEEVLIIKIKKEIEELQRARIYLGKALYDLGLLYLRLGKKENALIELRAAKELGVGDPEVDRIINQG